MDNQNEQQTNAADIESKRKENERETEEAHRLAAEQQQRDIAAGQKPVVNAVADILKSKLERNEFSVYTDENGNVVPPAREQV